MARYSDLVSKVLANNILANAAKQMADIEDSDKPTLDLVTKDWIFRLENDVVYQDCQFDAIPVRRSLTSSLLYDYETSKDVLFNITLVAYCRFLKHFKGKSNSLPSIIIANSEPLNKIARVMTQDFGPNINLSEEFKFNFKLCNLLSCMECSETAAKFEEKGYKLKKPNQPHICSTKLFNGKEIVNRFQSQMEDIFSQNFVALLHLKIDTRYNYTDPNNPNQKVYRIGGTVTDIIAFDEGKLNPHKESLNLGNLTFIDAPKESDIGTCKNSDYELNEAEADDDPINVLLHSNEDKNVSTKYKKRMNKSDENLVEDEIAFSKKPKVEEGLNFLI